MLTVEQIKEMLSKEITNLECSILKEAQASELRCLVDAQTRLIEVYRRLE